MRLNSLKWNKIFKQGNLELNKQNNKNHIKFFKFI